MTIDNKAMFRTDERAPENCLKWMFENEHDESIPSQPELNYELSFDDQGGVAPTVAIRNAEGESIGGVQLSYDELMAFARWGMQNGLALLNMQALQFRDLTSADVAIRNHLSAHVKDLFSFVKGEMPTQFDEVIEASAPEAIEKAIERTERDADIRLRLS